MLAIISHKYFILFVDWCVCVCVYYYFFCTKLNEIVGHCYFERQLSSGKTNMDLS